MPPVDPTQRDILHELKRIRQAVETLAHAADKILAERSAPPKQATPGPPPEVKRRRRL